MLSVTRVGVEPTKSQVLGLLALPICVPGHVQVAGPGVVPGSPGLWGLDERWPTRVKLQVSVSSRAHQPHESRLDTCRTCNEVAKGRLALPRPNGHDVLSVARLLFPPPGYVVSVCQ